MMKIILMSTTAILLAIIAVGCVNRYNIGKKIKRTIEKNVVAGTIQSVSAMPTPAESDYPDCNYTAEIQGEWLWEGGGISRKFIAVFPGFRDKKDFGTVYKKGDKVLLTLRPQELIPETERAIQIADENENFDLQYFYVQKCELLKNFTEPLTPARFAEESGEKSDTPANPPLPRKAQKVRAQQISKRLDFTEQEIQRLKKDLPDYAKKFQESFPALANNPNIIKANKRYMVWQGDAFFSLNQNYSILKQWPDISAGHPSLPSIIAFDRFCKSQNIDFVLVILPELQEAALDVLIPQMKGYRNPNRLLFCRDLLSADVDVIDATDAIVAGRLNHTLMFRYNTMDYHPYDGANWEAAALTAAQLVERGYLNPSLHKEDFLIKYDMPAHSYTKRHNAFPDSANGRFAGGTLIPAKMVSLKKKRPERNEIIVLSNSFNTTPWGNARFCDHLEYHCQVPILAVYSQNSNRGLPGKFLNLGRNKWSGIKTCVMYLCENHFTSPMVNLDLVKDHQTTITENYSMEIACSPDTTPRHYAADAVIPIPEKARGRLLGMNVYLRRSFPSVMGKCTGKEIKTAYFTPSLPRPMSIITKDPEYQSKELLLHFDIESDTIWRKLTIEKIEYYLK